jgi:FkbM family methyltransferase
MRRMYRVLNFIIFHPLGKKHKLISFYHFVRWQLTQFFYPGEKVLTFVNNTKMAVNRGDTGVTGNIYVGLHDFNEISFALHLLNENDIFADVGANVGFYSMVISNSTGAISYAFEPIHSTFNKLEKNIKLNELENKVISVNAAVGFVEGDLKMTNNLDTVNHVVLSVEASDHLTSIKSIKLDRFFSEINSPKLIKIDVEGYESDVIAGMENILSTDTLCAIIIELNGSGGRYGYDEKIVHEKLLRHSFFPCNYDPFERTITKLESYGTANTIYIRDIDFVTSRVKSATSFKVFGEFI